MFNEEKTVEQFIIHRLCGPIASVDIVEDTVFYGDEIGGWRFVAPEELPRQHSDVMVE